jgi:hypothetical protein
VGGCVADLMKAKSTLTRRWTSSVAAFMSSTTSLSPSSPIPTPPFTCVTGPHHVTTNPASPHLSRHPQRERADTRDENPGWRTINTAIISSYGITRTRKGKCSRMACQGLSPWVGK